MRLTNSVFPLFFCSAFISRSTAGQCGCIRNNRIPVAHTNRRLALAWSQTGRAAQACESLDIRTRQKSMWLPSTDGRREPNYARVCEPFDRSLGQAPAALPLVHAVPVCTTPEWPPRLPLTVLATSSCVCVPKHFVDLLRVGPQQTPSAAAVLISARDYNTQSAPQRAVH